MSERKSTQPVTVALNFLQAAVMTWGALSTEGAVHVALWLMVGLYAAGVLLTLMFFAKLPRSSAPGTSVVEIKGDPNMIIAAVRKRRGGGGRS